MKLIEALKEIKLIEKKLQANREQLSQYSSATDMERLPFVTEEAQRDAIKSILQSSSDLLSNMLLLKRSIERTNLETKVTVMGQEFSITELLFLKRYGCSQMTNTFQCLSTDFATRKVRAFSDSKIKILQFFDEKMKNDKLRYWMDFEAAISSTLEIVNATTDLVE
jgi:hypothetical protein